MRCTSSGTGLVSWMRPTICGPNVRFGTKWLSMTSTCTKSAPAMRASSASMLTKSAARMLGLMRTCGGLRGAVISDPVPALLAAVHASIMVEPWTPSPRCSRRCSPTCGRTMPDRPPSYIPELAEADPDLLAFGVVGPRGRVMTVGDDGAEFTIQSMSKPFVLALALQDLGRDAVLRPRRRRAQRRAVQRDQPRSAEPVGRRTRWSTPARSRRRRSSRGPTSMRARAGSSPMMSAFAGRSLWIDESVYASESATGDRNRALAHLLKSYGIIDGLGPRRGRDLLPAVLGARHGARPRRHGGHSRLRRGAIPSPASASSRSASRAM